MHPALLQKQLRDNASDLSDFCKDLKTWGEEMKRKEDSLKKEDDKPKKAKTQAEPLKKSSKYKPPKGPTDYAKWDKFDADLECEQLEDDIKDDSELTDEFEDSVRDEALVHKEKGNTYVKSQEWLKAIDCYTKAIKCYSYDPVFYANRALCHLKVKNFTAAEEDCTLSLRLDHTYVKALQRRAAARENLGNLDMAQNDLELVLNFEPKNKESLTALASIKKKLGNTATHEAKDPQRPVSKFTASRNKPNTSSISKTNISNNILNETKINDSSWPDPGCDITPVKIIKKPPHLQSKKPLKRIEIIEVNNLPVSSQIIESVPLKKHVVEHKEQKLNVNEDKEIKVSAFKKGREQIKNEKNEQLSNDSAWPPAKEIPTILKSDDLKVIEKKEFTESTIKDIKNTENLSKTKGNKETNISEEFTCPNNSVQFYNTWKSMKSNESKYKYLKCVKADKIPSFLGESLESSVFSSVLDVLSSEFIRNNEEIYEYLLNLTKVKRFSTFTIFMDSTDKNRLWKLITYLREQGTKSKEEIDDLVLKYEL